MHDKQQTVRSIGPRPFPSNIGGRADVWAVENGSSKQAKQLSRSMDRTVFKAVLLPGIVRARARNLGLIA